MDAIVNKSFVINFPITKNGDYAALDLTDTFTYSVYDTTGNVIAGLEDVNVEITEDNRTFVKIEIPAEANVIDEEKVFSNRIVIIDYTLNGIMHHSKDNYRVIPFPLYTCNEKDVRSALGLPETVVTDEMIDIFHGYLSLKEQFESPEKLEDALVSQDFSMIRANRAIVLSTALLLRTSIPLLVPRLESDSVTSQTRYTLSLEDFEKLFDNINKELNDLIESIDEVPVDERYGVDLLTIGNITDSFTGA